MLKFYGTLYYNGHLLKDTYFKCPLEKLLQERCTEHLLKIY